MANVVPGVVYRPIDLSGYPRRRKGRGACAHVAVSNSTTLTPSGGNSWHFYLPRSGPAIQYVDLDYVAYAQRDGNPTLVSWESQGGVDNPDGEPWTANQVEWGARIYAHLHKTEGAPLQVMPNSLPTSRGLGYHRLGVDPWRVAGGELWSSSYGKLCPGAAKIAQVPQIIARAREIVTGDDMPTIDEIFNHKITASDGVQYPYWVFVQQTNAKAAAAATEARAARIAAEQAKAIAEASAKADVPLSDADIQRIADATAAELAEDISEGYDLTAVPKADPA